MVSIIRLRVPLSYSLSRMIHKGRFFKFINQVVGKTQPAHQYDIGNHNRCVVVINSEGQIGHSSFTMRSSIPHLMLHSLKLRPLRD